MKCSKCNGTMTKGAPHGEGMIYQWECRCGHIVPVYY
jgi:hypothetical protein